METNKVIQIETEAFEHLVSRLVEYIRERHDINEKQWINEREAMSIIGISSKTTLLKLRQEGKIKYTQPYKRVIMYDKKSILEFLNNHIKETF